MRSTYLLPPTVRRIVSTLIRTFGTEIPDASLRARNRAFLEYTEHVLREPNANADPEAYHFWLIENTRRLEVAKSHEKATENLIQAGEQ